jgi:tetratricopeptide (TPR) repeat protein
VAIDFFYDKINWKNLLNKLPFFALSIIFGLITIDARIKASHLVEMNEHYNYFELIIITAFSIYRYIQLFLFHNDYSAFYTYPEKMNEWLPAKFYLVSLIFILIFIFISWHLYKKNKPALFGMAFFLITLSVMLKFIPAGMQYMADRYMYLPMFGLFVGLTQIREDFYKKHFRIFMGLIFLYIVLFAYKTIDYNRYWKNEPVLFEQTLKTQPNAVPVKNFLGIMHKKNGDFKEALKYFNEIISRYPEYGSAYNNRGNLYKDMQKYDLAMQDYNMALIYEGEKPEILLNIGIIYALTEDFEMALSFFNKALETDSEFYLGYFNRGKIFAMKGFYEKALSDMNETIRLNPYFSMAYYSRGMIYYNTGDKDKACKDLQKSKELGNSLSVEQIGKICN